MPPSTIDIDVLAQQISALTNSITDRDKSHEREHALIQQNVELQLRNVQSSVTRIEDLIRNQHAVFVHKDLHDEATSRVRSQLVKLETDTEEISSKLDALTRVVAESGGMQLGLKAAIASVAVSLGVILDMFRDVLTRR